MKTLLSLAEEAFKNKGGFSYSMNLIDLPESGYMVSIHGMEKRVDPDCRLALQLYVNEYAKRRSVDLIPEDRFLGCWFNGSEDSLFYLDVSEHKQDFDEAMQFARDNKQKAFWDIANCCEIRVEPKDTGE